MRTWRCDRQLSQQQLAQLVGTTQSHISEIETGTTDVTVQVLERCLNAMGLDLMITVRPSG